MRLFPLLVVLTISLHPLDLCGQTTFDADRTTISEETAPEPVLRFKYRLIPNAEVKETIVTANGAAIESRSTPFQDNPLNTSALLVMVDGSVGSSKQPRNQTVEANKQALAEILTKTTPRNLVGLYSFDNELIELSPIGAPFAQTREKLSALKATGLGTRLYRRTIDAIEKLAGIKAERKALLIFSDGKDEDTGFTLDDVLKAAKEQKVMIMAVGCPESPEGIPALGNLERAAVETGGFYVQMDLPPQGTPRNPANLASSVLGSLDGGGEVVSSLKNVDPGAEILVSLTTADGQKLSQKLERTPPPATPAPTPEATPVADATPAATPEPTPIPTAKERAVDWLKNNQLWVIAGGAALLALLAILVAAISRRKKAEASAAAFAEELPSFGDPSEGFTPASNPALAWLIMQDADASQVGLHKTASRIGRRQDNDIVFSNDSVSGHHAEIHMARDGSFTITDLSSGNGVLINGKKVTQSSLRDGDVVELGEVGFRFSLRG